MIKHRSCKGRGEEVLNKRMCVDCKYKTVVFYIIKTDANKHQKRISNNVFIQICAACYNKYYGPSRK